MLSGSACSCKTESPILDIDAVSKPARHVAREKHEQPPLVFFVPFVFFVDSAVAACNRAHVMHTGIARLPFAY
jgi:hypothetical protein